MRAVSSGTGGTGCGRRSDMGDLRTRKSSNAMAPHKAADYANGVRPFGSKKLHDKPCRDEVYGPGMRWCGLILNGAGSFAQASQMAWKGVLHRSRFRCLPKL